MEKVLIDLFIVPQESAASFAEAARNIQGFIETLPGFVEGYVFEREDGDSPYNFLTTAVWENEVAFENAKKAVAEEHQRRNYDPQAVRQQLGIVSFRSTFDRSPY